MAARVAAADAIAGAMCRYCWAKVSMKVRKMKVPAVQITVMPKAVSTACRCTVSATRTGSRTVSRRATLRSKTGDSLTRERR
jgi:hypothetical protein